MTEKILYQHGTLGALMAGLMDGTETIAHILEKGTLGLGTLHGLDGEVIFLDGVAYQGRSDGSVAQLDGSELTPMQQLQILRQILVFLSQKLQMENN